MQAEESLVGLAFVWLILRAFAGGTTALTGIEAISNGVQAFKPPESQNAAKTMVVMGFMAMSLFVGISFLTTNLHLVPLEEGESILSQMTRLITGGGFLYLWVQIFTALILFLAANTGYQAVPRLRSLLARDGFLPRWMQNRGDRLVFSSGIVVLAGAVATGALHPAFAIVDSLPVPVCRFARATYCRRLRECSAYGYDEVARQKFFGLRAPFRICWPGVITDREPAPAPVHELAVAEQFLSGPHGWPLADRNYWRPKLRARLAEHALYLLAPYQSQKREKTP